MWTFRYALRQLYLNAAFTFVAVASLALGTGANTAIFQLLDAIRLRALPIASPEELAEVRADNMDEAARGSWLRDNSLTNPLWEKIRDRQQAFSGIFAWATDSLNISPAGEVHDVRALWVTGDFFRVLGVKPSLGRLFTPGDDRRGCGLGAGAVISYSFWQREFGGDRAVLGRKIPIARNRLEVIGVTPPEFFGMEVGRSFDIAVPVCAVAALREGDPRLDAGTMWWLTVMGRLKPGISLARASALLASESLGVFSETLPPDYPPVSVKPYLAMKLYAIPAGGGISRMRDNYSKPLALLLAIAGAVLLIACANLANLMLARASARQGENALRLAIGASRAQLAGPLLAEGLLLSVAGVATGLLLARALSRFLVSFLATGGDPIFLSMPDDFRIFAFAATLAIVTAVAFSTAPALRVARTDPGDVLKAGSRSSGGRDRLRLRRALVCSQIAVSFALLMGTLLFARSLSNLQSVDAGLERRGMLMAEVGFGPPGLPAGRALAFRRELLERLRGTPGIAAVSETPTIPLDGAAWNNRMWMDGSDPSQQRVSMRAMVGGGYFRTMKTPLLAGRDLEESDMGSAIKVAVVNEEFARQFTGSANPVGKRFWIESTPFEPQTAYLVVGLAKNAKYRDLREPFQPVVYVPMFRAALESVNGRFMIRSSINPDVASAAVRDVLTAMNPQMRYHFRLFDEWVEESLLRERLLAVLSELFGVLALVLTAAGLFGVISYMAARRAQEIGIRVALGATRSAVMGLILRETAVLLLVGLSAGALLALAGGRATSGMLFGLQSFDPLLLLIAAATLALVAALASCLPAWRAARVNPVCALRQN